jgi:Carbohydrate esterase, sialic acid-specific acetylesterase
LTVGMFGGDAGSFGPELQLGHVLGNAYAEPVLIVKTGWKGRSLAKDFCPPTSESAALSGGFQWYRMMVDIERAASAIPQILGPDYKHFRVDIMGLVWWHGYTDLADAKMTKEYGANLERFLKAVRAELKQPYMSLIVAELGGQGPHTKDKKELQFRKVQEETVDKLGNYSAAFVPTSPYVKATPAIKDYTLYYGNAATMLEISQAFAMSLLSLDWNEQQGDGQYGWVFTEADVTANRGSVFIETGYLMMIGIVVAGVFSFVAIMRYGGRMDRAWNTAFSRLRPDDNKGIEMVDEDGFDDNVPRERSLPDIRRSGLREVA